MKKIIEKLIFKFLKLFKKKNKEIKKLNKGEIPTDNYPLF